MWWLITLLLIAGVAFFVVKMLMSQTQRQQAQHKAEQEERLAQSSNLGQQPTQDADTEQLNRSDQTSSPAKNAATDSVDVTGDPSANEAHNSSKGPAVGVSTETSASTAPKSEPTLNTNQGLAGAAGAVSAAVAAGAALSQASSTSHTATEQSSAETGAALHSESQRTEGLETINTGDTAKDVREMVKILNLDGADATRLGISADQLMAIRKGETDTPLDEQTLSELASRLRRMLG